LYEFEHEGAIPCSARSSGDLTTQRVLDVKSIVRSQQRPFSNFEYLNPLSPKEMQRAADRAWGELSD
jgi:hypothetical protein